VTVHDHSGRLVAHLWEGPSSPGPTVLRWDGSDSFGGRTPAGLYLVRADFGRFRLTQKVLYRR
jgi:hypothetical protein